jgi:cell division protein YceG involved in septum cleavage
MSVIVIIFGGGGGGLLLLLVAALVIMTVIGSGALVGLVAALTTMLIWLLGIMAFAACAGGVAWFLTRGYRAEKRALAEAAREQQRVEYEQQRQQRHIERQQQRAIENATAMAPVAAVISEAIQRGQGMAHTMTADDIADALLRQHRQARPQPMYRAEVLGKTSEER